MAGQTLDTLPTEILNQIFTSLVTVSSVLQLSATCHRLRCIYKTSKKLTLLADVAEVEFGPLDDAIQLLTHNASQPAHIRRSVNMSMALLKQVLHIGRVAHRWTAMYPLHKWKDSFENRRLLTTTESHTLRRAMYRLWLYDKAFHTSTHSRYSRMWPQYVHERALLLHNYDARELAEMLDIHLVIRDLIASELCPSDRAMRFRFQEQHINVHLNYSLDLSSDLKTYSQKYYANTMRHVDAIGWGDDIRHYYVVEDMMKLNPEQVLLLYGWRNSRWQVQAHIATLGEWFDNNGEVFSETLGFVLRQRGSDLEELKEAILDEEVGVVQAM